jgi:hypothetical protein
LDGLAGLIVKLGTLAGSMLFDPQSLGIFGPVMAMTLMQARTRIRQRLFPPQGKERAVAEALALLPDDYAVLDDVALPQGKGNLEYLIVGQNGLFAIEANYDEGELKCEGYEWYVNRRRIPSLCRHAKTKAVAVRSRLAAESLRKEENPAVIPLVVLANPDATAKLHQPAVQVLRLEELVPFIRDYKPASYARVPQSREEVRAIVRHLRSLGPNPSSSRLLNFLRLS